MSEMTVQEALTLTDEEAARLWEANLAACRATPQAFPEGELTDAELRAHDDAWRVKLAQGFVALLRQRAGVPAP